MNAETKTALIVKEKAYQIDFENIDEGFLYCHEDYVCHAETRGKAKGILWKKFQHEGMRLWNKEDVTFLNMPVLRAKQYDKYEFEGSAYTLSEIGGIEKTRVRHLSLTAILDNNNIKYCYIRKGSYYRPNSCGYTDFRHRAGVYTKQEAVSSARSCSELEIVPIDIEEHNGMLNAEIQDIQSRLLTTQDK